MSAAKSAPAKKRGLGRGLEALLGPKAAADAGASSAKSASARSSLSMRAYLNSRSE
jgi:ParB family transcriptional regulator, chromosome partitioning protein